MTQATNDIPGEPTTSSSSNKTKIAILGGGIASLTAAFELTDSLDLQSRYDVTVYQLGWRLGGKCASGRNAAENDRIEEHGLHVWFGFYDNAFDVMKRCYDEVKLIDAREARAGATARSFASIEEAFLPCDKVVLYDLYQERWSSFQFEVPPNQKTPGINDETLPSFWNLIYDATEWALAQWRKVSADLEAERTTPSGGGLPSHLRQLAEELGVRVRRTEQSVLLAGLHLVRALARHHLDHPVEHNPASPDPHLKQLCSLMDWCKGELWDRWVRDHLDHDGLRHYFSMFDVATAMVHGIVYDELFTRGFDSINDLEFMTWLQRHGAKDETLEQSLLVRAFYDMAFAFRHGYKEWRALEHRNMAAGVAVHDILRLLFTYKGSFYYKMNAGMGDTIFAPLYKVLKDRGVKFEFFHQVTKLGVGDDRASIDAIELNRQAEVKAGEYQPMVEVKGLHCWPSEPRWEQLVDGDEFKRQEDTRNFEWVDLDTQPAEYERASIPSADHRYTLKKGEDFDRVILGIPAPAILNNEICTELMKYDGRFERMIKETTSVMTQAFQVWLTKKPQQMGWPHDPSAIMTSFDEPVDTYCDMTHLLPQENWAADASPVDLVYCCGVMPDPSPDERPTEDIDSQLKADEYARRMVKKYVDKTSEPLWPNARGAGGDFAWDVLYDPQNRNGADRLDAQYTRANYQRTERYVLTPAGSVKHRLMTHETRFTNLLIVGDWIKNGLDAGCVEAAAISGRQAARRITRVEAPIPGENGTWLDPSVGDSPLARPKVGHPMASPCRVFSALRVAGGVATLGLGVAASGIESVLDCIGRLRPGPRPAFYPGPPPVRLPQYVEYGGIASAAGPFECTDATLDAFLLQADHAHLRALCAKVFGGPSGGAVDYRPLGSHVMLTFGDMKVRSSRTEIGYVRERHAAFWVMTAAVTRSNGAVVGQRLAAFVPSMFVDNPISLVGGREIYGFAKHGAKLTFPSDHKPIPYAVDAYGGQFGAQVQADYHRLLEVSGPALEHTEVSWRNASEFIDVVRKSVGAARPDHVSLSVTFARDVVEELVRHTARQVFLRQFRAPDNSVLASPSQVVEAKSLIHNLRGGPLNGHYYFALHPLDSHPLGDDLGLVSQNVPLAFRVQMDFTQEAGMVVWPPRPS
jgi:uncharacterized protein with NAD-binding domain and iron-sulfur cluster